MTGSDDPAITIELERRVLRLLCQDPGIREFGRANLQQYRWQNLLHKVIFDVVTGMPRLSLDQLRDQLSARLTNAGLPDFPWEEFFQPHGLPIRDAEGLIVRLRSST